MITYREYCKTIKEDWGTTSPIPKEVYADVDWRDNFKWIDLGLPSGTLWADVNIPNPDDKNGFWTWDDIMASPYKDYVPTQEQMEELWFNCKWKWNRNKKGASAVSKINGKGIFLPAEGDSRSNQVYNAGTNGYYWSSTPIRATDQAFFLYFYDRGVGPSSSSHRETAMPIRLVKNKN